MPTDPAPTELPPPLTTLAIMAKYWTPGRVKTRLGHSIGMPAAAALHRTFTLHLSVRLAEVGDRRVLSIAPDTALDRFEQEVISPRWDLLPQGEGDLGARLQRLFQTQLAPREPKPREPTTTPGGPVGGPPSAAATRRVIVIGADCPLIDADEIAIAAHQLDTHDVVLGPALDGGYYLIGLKTPWTARLEGLFTAIPWSSSEVFAITKQRAAQADLTLAVLPPKSDIDTIEDLERLCASFASAPPRDPIDHALAEQIEAILSPDPPQR